MLSAKSASHTTSRSWSGNSRPKSRRTHRLQERGGSLHAEGSVWHILSFGWRYWHAIDLGRDLQPVEVHVQLDVVLLYQLVLDAVDFGHDGDGRPGVLGPREGNARQHLLFTLQEDQPCYTSKWSSKWYNLHDYSRDEPSSLPSRSWKTKALPSPSAARAWRCRQRSARVREWRGDWNQFRRFEKMPTH